MTPDEGTLRHIDLDLRLDIRDLLPHITAPALHKIVDLEAELIEFGVDRTRAVLTRDDHAAIARTIRAEVTHLPREILDAWMATGPLHSRRVVAEHFRALKDKGHLVFDDAEKASAHYTLLTFTPIAERTFFGALPFTEAELVETTTEGVRMFLRLYGNP